MGISPTQPSDPVSTGSVSADCGVHAGCYSVIAKHMSRKGGSGLATCHSDWCGDRDGRQQSGRSEGSLLWNSVGRKELDYIPTTPLSRCGVTFLQV